MIAELNWPAMFAAIGTLITAVSGCMFAYAAVVRARREATSEAEKECQKKLQEARKESEELSDELHRQRMQRMDTG